MKNHIIDITKVKRIQTWIIFLLMIINLLITVFIFNELYFRIDMTEGRKFSISNITSDLIKSLDNNLVIEYYYSDKCNAHPLMSQIVLFIKDILIEYERIGKKYVNVIIEELNYQKDMEIIDDLQKSGFQFFPLSERKMGESRQTLAFSGIVFRYKDKEKIIPAITTDKGFEYLIYREIEKMLGREKDKIGVYLSKKDKKYEDDYKSLKESLDIEFDNVSILDSGANIPDDITILVLIGGENLSEYDIFQIDQFLMNGGKAFIAVNGVNIIRMSGGDLIGNPNSSKLIPLLKNYGFSVEKYIIGDNDSFYPIYNNNIIYRYPVWPEIKPQNFNKTHVAVKGLRHLLLFWPTAVNIDDNIKDKTEVLFHTTERAFSLIDDFNLDVLHYKIPFNVNEQKYDLAVAFEGKISTFFKDRDIPDNIINPNVKFSGNIKKSGNVKMVLICNDIIFEHNYINEDNESLYLLLNSIDWLTGNEGLIEIRSKQRFSRPLDKISKTSIDSGFYTRKNIIISISTYIMPLLFFIMAILIKILRNIKNRELRFLYDKSEEAINRKEREKS
ncbi:MAG: GldG family protein [Spirochaetes bacterium]|nr:GldG family protein [Spirochaetota bacterium]